MLLVASRGESERGRALANGLKGNCQAPFFLIRRTLSPKRPTLDQPRQDKAVATPPPENEDDEASRRSDQEHEADPELLPDN